MLVKLPQIVARSRSIAHYYTGKACKHGHVAARLSSNGACLTCAYIHRDKWRADNVELARDLERAKSAALGAHGRREKWLKWANKDNNRARILANVHKWRKENPERARALALKILVKRRAAKRDRLPVWYGEFDDFVVQEAADLAARRAGLTGIKWHIDHMIPLQARTASGLHCGLNLQVIPQALNTRKHNKMWLTQPGEWLRHI